MELNTKFFQCLYPAKNQLKFLRPDQQQDHTSEFNRLLWVTHPHFQNSHQNSSDIVWVILWTVRRTER